MDNVLIKSQNNDLVCLKIYTKYTKDSTKNMYCIVDHIETPILCICIAY